MNGLRRYLSSSRVNFFQQAFDDITSGGFKLVEDL